MVHRLQHRLRLRLLEYRRLRAPHRNAQPRHSRPHDRRNKSLLHIFRQPPRLQVGAAVQLDRRPLPYAQRKPRNAARRRELSRGRHCLRRNQPLGIRHVADKRSEPLFEPRPLESERNDGRGHRNLSDGRPGGRARLQEPLPLRPGRGEFGSRIAVRLVDVGNEQLDDGAQFVWDQQGACVSERDGLRAGGSARDRGPERGRGQRCNPNSHAYAHPYANADTVAHPYPHAHAIAHAYACCGPVRSACASAHAHEPIPYLDADAYSHAHLYARSGRRALGERGARGRVRRRRRDKRHAGHDVRRRDAL